MLKKLLLYVFLLVLLVVGLSYTPPLAHLRNFAIWGKHTIHDYKTHPTRLVAAGGTPQYWPLDSNFNKGVIPDSLLKIIDSNDTHAFLVFQDGKLLYERYWDGYTPKTLSGSFSAAKSMISLLIGVALDEGKIKSLEEPVGNYVPHFKEAGLDKVRIKDLLTMSSGTNYKESDKGYFSLNAYGYYGDDEEYMVNKMKFKEPAGQHWEYRSGDTQVLGLIVEKVFGQNISTLVSERFLKPMGAEEDALWLLDGAKKHEKAFCCFNGVARDYARFGELILHNGNWKGKQIVSEKYVKEATTPASYLKDPTENENPVDFYGYQYWMVNEQGHDIVFQNGLFGQYVYVIRDKNAVVVRLGESKVVKPIHHHQPEIFTYAAAALSVLK
jgi:CubicO group peptidase (beta-lactamase class C family)